MQRQLVSLFYKLSIKELGLFLLEETLDLSYGFLSSSLHFVDGIIAHTLPDRVASQLVEVTNQVVMIPRIFGIVGSHFILLAFKERRILVMDGGGVTVGIQSGGDLTSIHARTLFFRFKGEGLRIAGFLVVIDRKAGVVVIVKPEELLRTIHGRESQNRSTVSRMVQDLNLR